MSSTSHQIVVIFNFLAIEGNSEKNLILYTLHTTSLTIILELIYNAIVLYTIGSIFNVNQNIFCEIFLLLQNV